MIDEIIDMGAFLFDESDNYEEIISLLETYVREEYEEVGGCIFSYRNKDTIMYRILYKTFRRLLLLDLSYLDESDRELMIDSLLLYYDKVMEEDIM